MTLFYKSSKNKNGKKSQKRKGDRHGSFRDRGGLSGDSGDYRIRWSCGWRLWSPCQDHLCGFGIDRDRGDDLGEGVVRKIPFGIELTVFVNALEAIPGRFFFCPVANFYRDF